MLSIHVLRIVSWHHIGLVNSDMVNAVDCLLCVGIVLKLCVRSLALIGGPGVWCDLNPILS